MARNSQYICGAVLLCIVILFGTGVVFPKYIASHNLKKRAIFNSSVTVFKLVSKEHLVSNQTDFGNSINSSNIASKETETSPRSSFLQSIAFDRLQTPTKGKRLKRQTTSQDDLKEIFSWNFSLNITSVERTALHETSQNKSVTSDSKKLGVAVYVNNQGSVLSELQRTLDSVTSFLKDIFSSGTINSTLDFKGMNKGEIEYPSKESQTAVMQDYYIRNDAEKGKEPETISRNPIPESFQDVSQVSEFETGQSLSSLNLDGGSKNDSSVTKGRKGRIFFDIFGLRGKLLGRTSSASEVETTTISADVAQTETNILRGENLPIHVLQQKSERVTENSNQEANFNSDSQESSEMFPVKDSTDNTENLQTTQLLECPGCAKDSLGFQFIPNKVEEESKDTILETTDSTETLLTDEVLENLCKTLSNDLGQSHLSQLIDEQSETDDTVVDSFLINTATTEFSVQTGKESRFFSPFDSGSGRSDITSDNDLTSFGQVNEFVKFPSVLDCLLFFSKKRDTFQNPFDINDTENSIFPNFEHTSVMPNFEEQQLKFSSNLNSSVQTLDEILEGTETGFGKSKTLLGDENEFTLKDLSGKQETNSEPNDFNLGNKLEILESTDSDGVEKTSDDRRDGKFLSFFGFGSGSDVQENGSLSERFFNSFFGSGLRSLEDFDSLEEAFDLGSGDSLGIEGFSGDDTVLPVFERDLSEDTSITPGEPRFLSFLGFAGSGDGRELTQNSELIVTELSNSVDNECSNCSQDVKQLHKCDYECDFESDHGLENIDHTESGTHIPFNESGCDDCYSNAELLNKDNSSISASEISNHDKNITVYFDENPEKCNCFHGKDKKERVYGCDCGSYTLQASDVPYIDPENKFSTEIRLSKDPTGINVDENCNDCKHEEYDENPMPVTSPLSETPGLTYPIKADDTDRNKEVESRSHLDEINNTFTTFSLESINTEENLQQVHKTTIMKPRHFVGTIFLTGSGDGGLFGDDSGPIHLEEEERTVNPLVHSRRRGRLDDLSGVIQERGLERPQTTQTENHFSSSSSIEFGDNIPASPISKSEGEVTILKENITNPDTITFRPVIISNAPSSSSDVPLDFEYRSCIGARDCNVALGERCIRINSSSVCECGRAFVRQKLTRKCVAKRRTEMSLKLPAEMFHSDLRDPESARYKNMREKSIDTMWLLLDETPDIRQIVTEVNVAKFTAGSLIISMYLVLAVENESEAEILNGLGKKLQKALLDDNLMKRSSLNIRNATVLSVFNELDPCESAELNYCSRNAYCKRTEDSQRSYACLCKEHFSDVSSDPLFPGEKCIEKCPPKYCGPNGHCEIIENERHCLCNGMYFGERCEVPGLVILCSLTVTAIISLMVLCAVIIKLRCRKISYGGSPTFHRNEDIGQHSIAACRVSDAIALAENPGAKVSKFAPICTPLPVPTIRVIRPSLNDSSISYECDSTFDVTPTSERAESTGN